MNNKLNWFENKVLNDTFLKPVEYADVGTALNQSFMTDFGMTLDSILNERGITYLATTLHRLDDVFLHYKEGVYTPVLICGCISDEAFESLDTMFNKGTRYTAFYHMFEQIPRMCPGSKIREVFREWMTTLVDVLWYVEIKHRDDRDARITTFMHGYLGTPEGDAYLILHILSHYKCLEHGTALRHPWMDEQGKELLLEYPEREAIVTDYMDTHKEELSKHI